MSRTVDLVSVLGATSVFAGFTSGTGGGSGNHDIIDWQLENTFTPISASVPSVGFLGLLIMAGALAVLLTVMVRRQRRALKTRP